MSFDIERLTTPLRISDRIVETSDAITLEFEVPKDSELAFKFSAGQFLTLFLEIAGEIIARSYSICSSPQWNEALRVTVKRVKGGRGSNFIIDNLKIGDKVKTAPPAGHFFKAPNRSGARHWFLAAAGSGITPLFSILKTVLKTENQSRVTLVYSNRDPQSTIYREDLEKWQARFPNQLKIIFVYSQTQGRCEGALLDQILKNHVTQAETNLEAYLCGPIGFMNGVHQGLLKMGIEKTQIHEENFAATPVVTPSTAGSSVKKYFIGDREAPPVGELAQVKIQLSRETIEIQVAPEQNILEALIQAGHNPPYSCLEGNCMACVAKVQKGRVYQKDPGILLDENMENGETLTCQSFPDSKEITIDFDSL